MPGHNLKGTKEFECEFLIWMGSQGGLHIWLQFEIDPIPNMKLTSSPVFVSLKLHPFLGAQQVLLYQIDHDFSLLQPPRKIIHITSSRRIKAKVRWFVSIQYLERRMSSSWMPTGIVPEFGQVNPIHPFCVEALTKHQRNVSMHWLTLSVWPSVCGWYDELILKVTLASLKSSCQNRLVKTLSRSEMMEEGIPYKR